MTDDERAALVEMIARELCWQHEVHYIREGDDLQATVDQLWQGWVENAAPILAIIEPVIRTDERERCAARVASLSWCSEAGTVYVERADALAAIRALKDKPS